MTSRRFLPTSPRFKTFESDIKDYMHPLDLLNDDKSIYTQITFVPYNILNTVNDSYNISPLYNSGFVYLPPPKKIVEVPSVSWTPIDAVSAGASISNAFSAAYGAATAAGLAGGLAPNPFLFMLFKHPNFKEYNLSWTVTAENEKETNNIKKILDLIKYNMLPEFLGAVYRYPNVAIIKYKDDNYTHKFRPAVVKAIEIDYSGAGLPSFYQETNAPTIINFTINITEITLWHKEKYGNENNFPS